jgi:hypothetical protein
MSELFDLEKLLSPYGRGAVDVSTVPTAEAINKAQRNKFNKLKLSDVGTALSKAPASGAMPEFFSKVMPEQAQQVPPLNIGEVLQGKMYANPASPGDAPAEGGFLKKAWDTSKEWLSNPQNQYAMAALGTAMSHPNYQAGGRAVMDSIAGKMMDANIADLLAGREPTYNLPAGYNLETRKLAHTLDREDITESEALERDIKYKAGEAATKAINDEIKRLRGIIDERAGRVIAEGGSPEWIDALIKGGKFATVADATALYDAYKQLEELGVSLTKGEKTLMEYYEKGMINYKDPEETGQAATPASVVKELASPSSSIYHNRPTKGVSEKKPKLK